ncbi:hypothetical protein [Methylobacterium oxalidis]|uniref:hypothetical protein n=1 Tax=Methylobacterium oxalidis TaxID=944322 RepID=UPI0011BE26C5|nr:hypothetical protein [Methylobacterium oxalidis]
MSTILKNLEVAAALAEQINAELRAAASLCECRGDHDSADKLRQKADRYYFESSILRTRCGVPETGPYYRGAI